MKEYTEFYNLLKNIRYEIIKGALKMYFQLLADENLVYKYVDIGVKFDLWKKPEEETLTISLQIDIAELFGKQFTEHDSLPELIETIAKFIESKMDKWNFQKLLKSKKKTKEQKMWLRFLLRILSLFDENIDFDGVDFLQTPQYIG